ncbi:MAG: hypothetical protein ACHQIL_05850 [Steroidobacterales bacterium]
MRAKEPGQSVLMMLDVADALTARQIQYAVIGAMAAAVHGAVRASLDADAIVAIQIPDAQHLRREFEASGLKAQLRLGDTEDPIAALLALSDRHGNRVDLVIGLRGMDPDVYARSSLVPFSGEFVRVVGREDFIAMKAFAGGPQDISDAGIAIAANPQSLDLELLRRLALRFGRGTARTLEELLTEPTS